MILFQTLSKIEKSLPLSKRKQLERQVEVNQEIAQSFCAAVFAGVSNSRAPLF